MNLIIAMQLAATTFDDTERVPLYICGTLRSCCCAACKLLYAREFYVFSFANYPPVKTRLKAALFS